MSAPLRELNVVISAVASGSFDPDATRSGMFAEEDLSEQDSEDEEQPQHDELEEACEEVPWEPTSAARDLFARQGCIAFRRQVTRMIHAVADEAGDHFKCGRKVSTAYIRVDAPRFLHPMCKQCRPPE